MVQLLELVLFTLKRASDFSFNKPGTRGQASNGIQEHYVDRPGSVYESTALFGKVYLTIFQSKRRQLVVKTGVIMYIKNVT